MWTCPECGRSFGRHRQGHDCAPGLTIEEYFSTGPDWERPIYERVRAHLESLGDVYVEPVSVGIFFKKTRTFVQLRPMAKWVALGMVLPRTISSPRIARKVVPASAGSWYHVVNLRTVDDVDDQVLDWITESYVSTPDA